MKAGMPAMPASWSAMQFIETSSITVHADEVGRQDGASDSDPLTLAEYVTQCPKILVRWCVSVATKVPVPLRTEPEPTSPRTPFTAYRWLTHPVKPDSCVTVPPVKSPATALSVPSRWVAR